MRLPQIICAKNYLSIETINQLKKEIGVVNQTVMLRTFKSDIEIIKERDPAARGILEIFLCYPGFQSIVIHRFTHKLWKLRIPLIPRLLSHLNRSITGIEIHPGAKNW